MRVLNTLRARFIWHSFHNHLLCAEKARLLRKVRAGSLLNEIQEKKIIFLKRLFLSRILFMATPLPGEIVELIGNFTNERSLPCMAPMCNRLI